MTLNNCPPGCYHCWNDRMDELQERDEARLRREEDDANLADQDLSEDEVASLMMVEPYR